MSKSVKIEPMPGIVYLKTEEVMAGSLDTSSRESVVETAEILAVGKDCGDLKKGDKIHVKLSWASDTVMDKGVRYVYVAIDTNAILSKVS